MPPKKAPPSLPKAPAPASRDDNEQDDNVQRRRRRLRAQLDSLHQEMELADYGSTEHGQKRRKLTREESKSRAKKRKALEKQDRLELAVEKDGRSQRLRGSKAAQRDEVIRGSQVLTGEHEDESEADEDDDDAEGSEVSDGDKKPRASSRSRGLVRRRRKQTVHSMKALQSKKHSQRLGEAMDAHTRGKHKETIEKLKQIARDVPSEAQVYSSLGMVYEQMLREAQNRSSDTEATGVGANASVDGGENQFATTENDVVPDSSLAEQLDLAKKAYGSYHIVALLWKKDSTRWVKAADMAAEIADIHTSIMLLPSLEGAMREYHRSEKERWLSEAKNDYQAADRIAPAGIDVPAKLASVLIELGHLSEALTLLTDLKNHQPADPRKRSDFESSYKAWLLYADLMLRIGHECTQWNQGIETYGNYMFRRWLRKFAATFDWKERRLQALVKALEAAVGSKCCEKLMSWLEKRVISLGSVGTVERNGERTVDAETSDAVNHTYEAEKALLLRRNENELAAFDKTTTEMSKESGRASIQERARARKDLVHGQREALAELTDEFSRTQATGVSNGGLGDSTPFSHDARTSAPLKASGSVKAVNSIAAELMRHSLLMELYDAGKLVGEVVSVYCKDRAAAYDKREEARRKFEDGQKRATSIFAMQTEDYDAAEGHSDEDQSDLPLSDDEEIEENSQLQYLESLRRGTLNAELSVYYALSLLGEGGRDYVALKSLESVKLLEQEPLDWLKSEDIDTGVTVDHMRKCFHRAATEPLGRTRALSLVVRVLGNSGKESSLGARVTDLFDTQVEMMTEHGLVELALSLDTEDDDVRDKVSEVISIVVAAARFRRLRAESELSKEGSSSVLHLVTETCKRLGQVLHSLWQHAARRMDASGPCRDVLKSILRGWRLAAKCDVETRSFSLFEVLKGVVATISDSDMTIPDTLSELDLQTVPIASTSFPNGLLAVALRAFNLAVSQNVSSFCGWASEDFGLAATHRISVPNYFGIRMSEGLVSGLLPQAQEEELAAQWDKLKELSVMPSFSFRTHLTALRESDWYRDARENREKALQRAQIALHGEEEGLEIMLSFSRTCLSLAEKAKGQSARTHLLLVLSVLLPVSQFVLNLRLWDAKFGETGSHAAVVDRWKSTLEQQKKDVVPPSKRPGYIKRSKRAPPVLPLDKGDKALYDWFDGEREDAPLSNIIPIPCAEMLAAWNTSDAHETTSTSIGDEEFEAMKNLDSKLRLLRACFSEGAVERASLNVASSLLDVLNCPRCQNPFVCMQQAALFASQASKLGSSDNPFKVALPKPDECTPIQALGVLGRADCLQAVYFCAEAAFLCSYVASVCASRKVDNETGYSRWAIIRVLAYNLSVAIRFHGSLLQANMERKEDCTMAWECAVVKSLMRGRAEGQKWWSSIGGVSLEAQEQSSAPDPSLLEISFSNQDPNESMDDEDDNLPDAVAI